MLARYSGIVFFALLIADPAQAHHVMGNVMPATFRDGLLSGLGHPVIGLDHLAAVLAVGVLAASQPKSVALAAGYVVASMIGAAAHIGEAGVPNAEVFVALSVVALGLLLFRNSPLRQDVVFALFSAAGLLNGYALGESIAGAERTPIVAYFIGLALIQTAIALAALYGARLLASRDKLHLLALRTIGAFAVGAGVAAILQHYATGA